MQAAALMWLRYAAEALIACRWLSTETQDKALAAFAGELLALAGAWESSAIALKPFCIAHFQQPSAIVEILPPDSNKSTAPARSAFITMMVAGLQLMADYLVDPDVLVIKSAQFTLRLLLATAAGKEALSHVDPVARSYLQVSPVCESWHAISCTTQCCM